MITLFEILQYTTLTISILIATRGQTMNKRDIKIFDNMICEAWNDSNAFCRKLKDYIGRNFNYVPELKKRCTDPYWENRTKQQ